jgi:hypothetical protein
VCMMDDEEMPQGPLISGYEKEKNPAQTIG